MDSELLNRLRDPDCYPGSPDSVEIRQTHLSVVCLAGDRVYKLKKPVRFPFADFTDPEVRRAVCHDEVRLNRRLCPDLYLDVVPLRRTVEGSWTFRETGGPVADHAVLMRRMPEDRMLDRLLERGEVFPEEIREIARIMAHFHRRPPSPEALEAGSPEKQIRSIRNNLETASSFPDSLFDPLLLEELGRTVDQESPTLEQNLRSRADRGCVVEGHGDLHARNICLSDPPCIFDCIEFSLDFRCGDTATENAFLVMDLIHRGHPELARVYLDTYSEESEDFGQASLMPQLTCFRAMVRATVNALAWDDDDLSAEEKESAGDNAQRYLLLAAASILGGKKPCVVLGGLPATGKSTIAAALSERSGWPILSSDRIRKEIAGVSPGESLPDRCYTDHFSDRVYAELFERALDLAAKGPTILDANFRSLRRRCQLSEVLGPAGVSPAFFWLSTRREVVKERLRERARKPFAESDADWDVFRRLEATVEVPGEDEPVPWIELDGSRPSAESVSRILIRLFQMTH